MKVKRRSSFLEAWIRLRKNKLAIVCLAVVCLLILLAVFADLFTPYENAIANNSAAKFAKPGQFAILMANSNSERSPFTLIDWNADEG